MTRINLVDNSHLESPLDDIEYDALCKRLLDEWDNVDHPQKKIDTSGFTF
jgi:hypothetical protein